MNGSTDANPHRQLERRWSSRAGAGGVALGVIVATIVHAVIGGTLLPSVADLALVGLLMPIVSGAHSLLRRMGVFACAGVAAVGMLGLVVWALL